VRAFWNLMDTTAVRMLPQVPFLLFAPYARSRGPTLLSIAFSIFPTTLA
jgi:hypothetical protein